MSFKLRPYQIEAVESALRHFKNEKIPAVIVLPTGAGKSLVIAELARLALGRVLVLAHVRELVEQNYKKFIELGFEAGIYSAGLSRKESAHKTIFGSIQSVARSEDAFFLKFSIVIIDECHRVSQDTETQYQQVISKIKKENKNICILGLTATPYRLGVGWIYEVHGPKKLRRTKQSLFFQKCIFELTLGYMIKNKYLTPPLKIDSPVACYDFSELKLKGTHYVQSQINSILKDQKRITPSIIKNIIEMSKDRQGVMIFTSSVHHAQEIMQNLPPYISALVIGETLDLDRNEIISAFKEKKIKFLVNVSVLTTGFDAPHVDVIAILRPTESQSLYQQIIGRGLRLSPDKNDCLILDYTGQNHDIFNPEIENSEKKTNSVPVEVVCPSCGGENQFWGILDDEGNILEHFGRTCQGIVTNPVTYEVTDCSYRFRFKRCDQCDAENDISARKCEICSHLLIDTDQKLKEAMLLKDAHVMHVDSVQFLLTKDKNHTERLEIQYFDFDGNKLKEYYYLNTPEQKSIFYYQYIRFHNRRPEIKLRINSIQEAIQKQSFFRTPVYLIARKEKYFWSIREKIF